MIKILVLAVTFLFAQFSFAQNKVEQLFLWKISDELKLNVQEEKKLTSIVQTINQKKIRLTQQMEKQADLFVKASSNGERSMTYQAYERTLKEHNQLNLEELTTIKSLLGLERLAKYLFIKKDFTEKVKSLLVSQDKSEKDPTAPASHEEETPKKPMKVLPPPKIIEE